MKFRLKAFSLHLAASAVVLTLVLGGLYLGWYRWPGWYLCAALTVVPILLVVDLTIGPLLTLLVANPRKPRRELARDIAVIASVQLVALVYGAGTLWNGRPLYYAFSEDRLQLVQASDLGAVEVARALKENPALAPHWYSLPRWVWAPLPADPAVRQAIVKSAVSGGDDVIQMPRYFHPWEAGLPTLRARLVTVDGQADIRLRKVKPRLKAQMFARKFDPEQPVTLLMTGHGAPLVAVFDRDTLRLRALLRSDR
ncbi:MAG TPA: hypothetical protein VMT49_09365 [Steroidobacteraceae bacterium]|nr:hypothetical protein [Steroidobacteraceae bacterium]